MHKTQFGQKREIKCKSIYSAQHTFGRHVAAIVCWMDGILSKSARYKQQSNEKIMVNMAVGGQGRGSDHSVIQLRSVFGLHVIKAIPNIDSRPFKRKILSHILAFNMISREGGKGNQDKSFLRFGNIFIYLYSKTRQNKNEKIKKSRTKQQKWLEQLAHHITHRFVCV